MAMGVKDNDASFSARQKKRGVSPGYDRISSGRIGANVVNFAGGGQDLPGVMSLRSGLLEMEDAGCSCLPFTMVQCVLPAMGRGGAGRGR